MTLTVTVRTHVQTSPAVARSWSHSTTCRSGQPQTVIKVISRAPAGQKTELRGPSIYPFPSASPGPGCGGSCLNRDTQTSLSPDTFSSSSWRIPRHSQASQVTYVVPACPGSSSGSPPSGACPSYTAVITHSLYNTSPPLT